MLKWIKKKIKQFIKILWKLFLNGLFTILPIALTVGVFKLTFDFIMHWLEPLRQFVPAYLDIPYGEAIFVILVIFLLGSILKTVVIRSLVNTIESILIKLPLVRPVYTGFKQLVQAFTSHEKITFKKVVLIEFPRKGMYSLAFLTSELDPNLAPTKDKNYFNIFIPTTPNPTSGYFIILPEDDIHVINITRQQAMAMIISGGIIQPECSIYDKTYHTKSGLE